MAKKKKTYGVAKERTARKMSAPVVDYVPHDPRSYRAAIGMIGCGGITGSHLSAYKKAGYNVVALCDVREEAAKKRQADFFPEAKVYTDYRQVLNRDDIDVVDIATHPAERAQIIEAAIHAGKHVLSQKPFVLDLDLGQRLVDLADRRGVKLAVNQNGRWAPHFSYMRNAINKGLIGPVFAAHLSVHWDHEWIANTVFNNIHHVILYDFAIHWFDIAQCFMNPRKATRVFASLARGEQQISKPPLLGQAVVEYEGGQASFVFDACAKFGPQDRTYLAGTKGTLLSIGPNLGKQGVTIYTAKGFGSPKLKGSWFNDGFHGTMGELLCAIEQNRQPSNNARDNLKSLEICFAAVHSADTGQPQTPGNVRRLNH